MGAAASTSSTPSDSTDGTPYSPPTTTTNPDSKEFKIKDGDGSILLHEDRRRTLETAHKTLWSRYSAEQIEATLDEFLLKLLADYPACAAKLQQQKPDETLLSNKEAGECGNPHLFFFASLKLDGKEWDMMRENINMLSSIDPIKRKKMLGYIISDGIFRHSLKELTSLARIHCNKRIHPKMFTVIGFAATEALNKLLGGGSSSGAVAQEEDKEGDQTLPWNDHAAAAYTEAYTTCANYVMTVLDEMDADFRQWRLYEAEKLHTPSPHKSSSRNRLRGSDQLEHSGAKRVSFS